RAAQRRTQRRVGHRPHGGLGPPHPAPCRVKRIAPAPARIAGSSRRYSCAPRLARDIRAAQMPTLFLIVLVDLIGFGLVIPLLPFYALRFTTSPEQVTVLLAVYSLMQLFTAPLWGRLSDRIGRRPVLMVSMAASVLAYLWIGGGAAVVVPFNGPG